MNSVRMEQVDEISLIDLFVTIKENIKLLIICPVAAGAISLGVTFLISPTFTAKTQFLPPQQSGGGMAAAMLQGLGTLGGLAGAAAGLKNPADQYVAFLKSDSVERGLVERFKLRDKYEVELVADAIKSLGNNTKITSGKDGLIDVEVDDKDPRFAAELANGYVEELSKLLDRIAVTDAQQRRQFFDKKLQQTKEKMIAAQQALEQSGFQEGALRAEPRAAAEAYAVLKAQVTNAQVRLQSMRAQMTDEAAEYKTAQAQYVALVGELAKIEAVSSGKNSGDYLSKYRDFKYQETLFELMAKQYEYAKLDEAREGAFIQVIDIARPPERKSAPKRLAWSVMASLATGLLLILYIFAKDGWSNGGRNKR